MNTNTDLDDQIEKLYREISKLRETEILESTLKNCEYENQIVKSNYELQEKAKDVLESDEEIPSTSKCGKCDYASDDECDLKLHMESHHEIFCNICDHKSLKQIWS